MPISPSQAQEMIQRLARSTARLPNVEHVGEPVTSESKLHRQIMDYCDQQWPRWKYIHSRMDRATTTAIGVEDFTIFAPGGALFHIEAKAKGGKLSEAQRNWAAELRLLGHIVHVVYSFEEFLNAIHN